MTPHSLDTPRPMRLLAAAKRCEVAEASCQVGPTTCGRDAGRLDL